MNTTVKLLRDNGFEDKTNSEMAVCLYREMDNKTVYVSGSEIFIASDYALVDENKIIRSTVTWCADDIIQEAICRDIVLSEEQAQELLLSNKNDILEYGWDGIRNVLSDVNTCYLCTNGTDVLPDGDESFGTFEDERICGDCKEKGQYKSCDKCGNYVPLKDQYFVSKDGIWCPTCAPPTEVEKMTSKYTVNTAKQYVRYRNDEWLFFYEPVGTLSGEVIYCNSRTEQTRVVLARTSREVGGRSFEATTGEGDKMLDVLFQKGRTEPDISREREMASELIDTFEDFLEDKGVSWPDDERDENAPAIVCGMTYAKLEDDITEYLEGCL